MRTTQRTLFAAVLAVVALAAASPLHAESVNGLRAPENRSAAEPKLDDSGLSLSARLGVSVDAKVRLTDLGALDVAKLLAEDTNDKGAPLRTGVSRDLRMREAEGGWTKAPGGWIWAADVRSADAKAIRLHFTLMNAPLGAQAQVCSPSNPEWNSPVYERRGPLDDGDFWTPYVPGERIRAEYFVPGDDAQSPATVPFIIDAALHMYRSPFDPVETRSGGGNEVEEGTCHNDVMCFPAWALERDATARIDFVSGGSGFLCTGQLINNSAGDLTPYFLTANHCISTNAVANTAVLTWDWQRLSCGGALPSMGSLPTSSVCTLLANGTGSDFSLLMVEGRLPAGRGWVGWNTGLIGPFVTTIGIHHPDGAFKRISFGSTQLAPPCGGSNVDHMGQIWGSGVTEGGSSGSGLYLDGSHQLVGQLHCGASSCDATFLPDSYGRFSFTFGGIAGFMTGGSDDAFENNDLCATPWALSPGTYFGRIVKSVDEDWFAISAGANAQVNISISFTHSFGDIDMALYTSCGTLVASSTSTGNSETINYMNTTGASPLLLRVYLFSDTRNQYDLTVGVTPAPNINATVTPPGFSWPIVPRTTGDAGGNNAVLPSTLDGDVNDTWLNWAIQHEGPGVIGPEWHTHIYRDWEQFIAFGMIGANNGPGSYQALNIGVLTVPGGRHSLTNFADVFNSVVESNESDNVWTGQYVWSPTPLANQANAFRGPAPHVGFYPSLNQDGYGGAGDYWGAFGIIPQGTDDADLYLYNDYANSLTGFQSALVGSAAGGQSSDFVIWNNNWLGFGASRQAGVVRYSGGTSNYVIHHSNEVSSVSSLPTAYATSYVTPVTTMGANDVVKLHEVYLDSSPGLTYTFTMENLSGSASLNISLYDRGGTYFSKFDWIAIGSSSGPGGNATFNFQPTTSGWYAVAVWKSGAADIGLANDYQLRIGPSLSNLSETIAPPAGWDDVIAPRNDNSGIPTVSATLDGNATNTWATWAIGQLGPNSMPAWETEAWLDEEPWSALYAAGSGNPPNTYAVIGSGPYPSRGGRHTVIAFADRLNFVAESDEGDNRHDRQLIWSPLDISTATPISRLAPPHIGYGPWYNADGLHYTRNPSLAWIVSAAPPSPSDDYDLWLATDYASSTSGYSIFPAYSLWGGNSTEYVVGHFQGTPNDLYPEITRTFSNAGGAGVAVDANTSLGRFGSVGAAWLGQSMAAGRLADVYEVYMDAGNTVHITLRRQSGTGDLGFELFSGAAGTMGGRGWGTPAIQLVGHLAELTYTATVSGWHPIAVYRHNGTDSGTPLTYDLVTSATAPVGVGDVPETTELLFAGARPNPVRDGTRFAYSLPQAGNVRLALYDVGGRQVRMLVDGVRSAGSHNEAWDGRGDDGGPLSSGLYWARFEAAGKSFTRRVSVLR